MAKDSSFDVVSEVNMQEVDNAFQQATREISQRYDLKDSGATIELSKGDKLFTINAPADFVSKQIVDVLSSKLIKRGIDLKAVSWDAPQAASGGTVRVLGHIVEGIDQAHRQEDQQGHQGTKAQGQGDHRDRQARVSSASKDALPDRDSVPARPGLRPAAAVHQLPLISIERTALQHGYTVGLRALHHPRVR